MRGFARDFVPGSASETIGTLISDPRADCERTFRRTLCTAQMAAARLYGGAKLAGVSTMTRRCEYRIPKIYLLEWATGPSLGDESRAGTFHRQLAQIGRGLRALVQRRA